MKRGEGNFEDQIRAANELLGAYVVFEKKDEEEGLRKEICEALKIFVSLILNDENAIATSQHDDSNNAISTLVNFLLSFASRMGSRDRLNIFTTNYDRIIEAGSEIAGIHLLDRFVGNITPIFRSSRLDIDLHYNPPGIRGEPRYLEGVARFTKLHGSIDWFQCDERIRRLGIPFGAKNIEPFVQSSGLVKSDITRLMIYPNAAKDRETALFPYIELFRDFASAICRPNSVLVTYGYSFGDDHINRIIMDMLTIPSTHLVMISYADQFNRMIPLCEEHHNQVSLLLGPELGDITNLTHHYLPKSCIDQVSYKMSEILKRRCNKDSHIETPTEMTTEIRKEL